MHILKINVVISTLDPREQKPLIIQIMFIFIFYFSNCQWARISKFSGIMFMVYDFDRILL